jgi:hypothetical protein
MFNHFQSIEFEIPKELAILLDLNSLPKEYNILVKTLTNWETLPKFEEVKTSLLNEEMQLKMDERRDVLKEAFPVKQETNTF